MNIYNGMKKEGVGETKRQRVCASEREGGRESGSGSEKM